MFSQWTRQKNVDKHQSARAGFFLHHLVRLLSGGGDGLVNQCIVGRIVGKRRGPEDRLFKLSKKFEINTGDLAY